MTLITYDTFAPGTILGEWEDCIDASLSSAWSQLFGAGSPNEPAQMAGLALILLMRAYLNIVTPRPPGNIHAKQKFSLDSLPQPGETVRSSVSCLSKEIRRERRYVQLQAIGQGANGRTIYTGQMNLIWAA